MFSFSVQKMEAELNAERDKLLADKTLVENELKTVNEDLTTQLTAAKSQVSDIIVINLMSHSVSI